MCLFAYSSRTDTPICTKLGKLIPWDQKENTGAPKVRKSVLSSIPGEGVSCSSETKHDRRMVPEPKLFFQNQKLKPRKIVLGSIPSEDCFCSSDTKHDKKSAKIRVVCFEEEIIETYGTKPKTVLGSSPDEEVLCSSKTKHNRKTAPRQNFFDSEKRLQELRSQTRKLYWVRLSVKILGLVLIFL
jgi:hypothetical protein